MYEKCSLIFDVSNWVDIQIMILLPTALFFTFLRLFLSRIPTIILSVLPILQAITHIYIHLLEFFFVFIVYEFIVFLLAFLADLAILMSTVQNILERREVLHSLVIILRLRLQPHPLLQFVISQLGLELGILLADIYFSVFQLKWSAFEIGTKFLRIHLISSIWLISTIRNFTCYFSISLQRNLVFTKMNDIVWPVMAFIIRMIVQNLYFAALAKFPRRCFSTIDSIYTIYFDSTFRP